MHSAAAPAVFLAGCALLVAAVRWWRPQLPALAALGYVALTAAFFAQPLGTGALQVPADLAYEWLPFSDLVPAAEADRPRNFFQADTLLEQLPFHTLVRQRLLAGEAPLWSHEMGTGQPLLGNGQSAPFAPLHLLALPLAPARALTVAGAWQILLGLLTVHALLLWLGAGPWGAALGAVAAGLSSYAVVWIYDTPGMAAAWVPGLLLGILLVRAGEPRGWTGLVVCALGLALAGHPETMAHAGMAAAAVAGAALVGRRRGPGSELESGPVPKPEPVPASGPQPELASRPASGQEPGEGTEPGPESRPVSEPGRMAEPGPVPESEPVSASGPQPESAPGSAGGPWRFVGALVAAAALALALAAPALLPMWDAIPESVRGKALERSPENFQPPPFEARLLLPLVSPLAFGSPPDGDYQLKWSFNEVGSGYAGLLTLALALAGALALRGRPLLLLAAGAAALLVALRLPPLFDLMLRLPVVGPGAHGRLRELWVLAVALAAGLALERVAAERLPRAVAAALIAAAGAGLALAPPPGGAPWPRAWWAATLLGAAAVLAALLVPRLRPAFAPLALVAVTADLFLLGVRYHPAQPPRYDLAPPPTLAYLMRESQAAATPFRVSFEDFDLPSNLNALYGLWDPRGYDPMRPEDAARMVGWWLGHRHRFYQNIGDSLPALDQAAHDYLAVRYLETSHERRLPPPWRLAFEGRGGRVWENPQALPLFFMPQSVERLGDTEEAQQAAMAAADFRQTAWIATPAGAAEPGGRAAEGGPGGGGGPASRAQSGEVRGLRVRANGFDLEAATPTGGLVVSSVSYAAGWEVEIDGTGRPAVEVNGGFLGCRVPPGGSAVHLRYRPRGWPRGLALFAAGLLAALLAAWGRRRRRGRPQPTPALPVAQARGQLSE
jgi:Bacterial membrane protein YfhO